VFDHGASAMAGYCTGRRALPHAGCKVRRCRSLPWTFRKTSMRTWLPRIAALLIALVLLALLVVWLVLRASVPTLDGERALPGLGAPAQVTRDALGVATIEAASATDAARALGYVHAQERWF